MEIFTLLETLEDILEKGKNVPFTEKCIVDKNELLDIIKEIRLNLPDELKQAKWIREERERIIAEAQKEAEDILKEADNKIISMVDEHEITRKAYNKRDEIIAKANEMYREYNRDANSYADSILGNVENNMTDLENTLSDVEKAVQNALQSVQNTIQASLETIKADRKELK